MKTTELIKFVETNDVTEDQLYNLLIEDFYECPLITPESIANPVAQQLIRFFMYQIQEVLFPVIRNLRTVPSQTEQAGKTLTNELLRDRSGITK